MTPQEMALRMYPFWILGLFMFVVILNSKYKDILRVDKKALLKFCGFLAVLTIYRIIMYRFVLPADILNSMTEGAKMIPPLMSLTVPWEDLCHGIPVFLTGLLISKKKWYYRPIYYSFLVLMMVSFGLGHLYQGWLAVIALSFYVPYTISIGRKYGFGTVMLGHMLYDLVTLLSIKAFVG